ncbi:transposase [mine drainage metagenome]|uniref:Transposase n=1 Tax=mine drainage metagenome TaxID=410659 RepID=T1CJW8_9ZZZZ
MYKTYFAKDAIEKVFRTSKGDLSLGPVRYRRKDRLDAYATVVYMAYLLWSWAERRLQEKYPTMRLSEAMRVVENVSWVRFGAGKLVREWTTRLTTKQEEILSAVGVVSM